MTEWHVSDQALGAYLAATIEEVEACSIEAHLVNCSTCQASIAAQGDPANRAATWMAIVDELDSPDTTWLERLLGAFTVSPATARLVSATPALRLSWALAVAAAVAISIVSSRTVGDDPGFFLFAAPLVPLLAIGAAFGPMVEPTHEIAVAAPFDKLRLLALRASIVLVSAFAALAIGAFALPMLGRTDVTWLLPALALVSVGLCLTTWMRGTRAVLIAGSGWVVLVGLTTEHHRLGDVTGHCPVFQASGQLGAAIVLALALMLTVKRFAAFDRWELA